MERPSFEYKGIGIQKTDFGRAIRMLENEIEIKNKKISELEQQLSESKLENKYRI